MPIPHFNEYGYIFPGTHPVTFQEIEQAYLYSEHRKKLWAQFLKFKDEFIVMGVFKAIEFYGSFFSEKPDPGDIDLALEFHEKDLSSKVNTKIFDKTYHKTTYQVDLVLKEPNNPAYKSLVPETYKFSSKSLYTFRRLKRDEQSRIAKILRKAPFEFAQEEFKGILRIEL